MPSMSRDFEFSALVFELKSTKCHGMSNLFAWGCGLVKEGGWVPILYRYVIPNRVVHQLVAAMHQLWEYLSWVEASRPLAIPTGVVSLYILAIEQF